MHSTLLLAFAISAAEPAKPAESMTTVVVGNCSQELSTSSARSLRTALAGLAGTTVISEDRTVELLGGRQRGAMADVERLLASARLDYSGKTSTKSSAREHTEQTLAEAMAILLTLPPSDPDRWEMIQDVASFQVMNYWVDRRATAEQILEKIIRVDPTFQFDRSRYSPDMWSLADKVRARVKAQSTSHLRVTSKPTGISVSVDGRIVGKTPFALPLPSGEYRVEGVFGNARGLARTVHVSGDTSVELEQSFDGSVQLQPGPCVATGNERGKRLTALVKLATFLGTRQTAGVWLEEPSRGEVYLAAALVDAANGQEVREAKVKAIGGQVSAEALQKLARFVAKGDAPSPVEPVVVKPRPVGMESAPPPSLSVQAETGSSRQKWGLTIGGAGLAAVTSGVVFQILGKQAYDDEKKAAAAGDSAKYQSAKSSASSRRTTAMVLYGIGAAGIGVGTYLYLSGRPGSPVVSIAPIEGGAVAMISGRLP